MAGEPFQSPVLGFAEANMFSRHLSSNSSTPISGSVTPNGLVPWAQGMQGNIQPFHEQFEIVQSHRDVDNKPRESFQFLVI